MKNYGGIGDNVTTDSTIENCTTTITNYINKDVITQNDTTDVTFKGNEIISYSIAPKGVAKASINTTKGIVTFEKYDADWYGEVSLALETNDGTNTAEHYIHNFSVEFNEPGIAGFANGTANFSTSDFGDEFEGYEELENEDIEDGFVELTDEEEEDVTGGATAYIGKNGKKFLASKLPAGSARGRVPSKIIGAFKYVYNDPSSHSIYDVKSNKLIKTGKHERVKVIIMRNGQKTMGYKCKWCGVTM